MPHNTYSGSKQSATLKKESSRSARSERESEKDTSMTPPSGMMSPPSTQSLSIGQWIWSLRDSRASHTHLQVNDLALRIPATSGQTPFASLEKSEHLGSYWRMSQLSFLTGTSEEYSQTFPKAAISFDGRLYLLSMSVHRIFATDYGLWPTPLTGEASTRRGSAKFKAHGGGITLTDVLGGKPNPRWVEWLMGWPVGWADNLSPLEKDKFQEWLKKHGK